MQFIYWHLEKSAHFYARVIVWNNFLYFQGPKAAPRMKPGKNSPQKKNKKTKKTKKKPWEKRENVSDLVAIGFDLTSDWLRGWRGFFLTNHRAK